MDILGRTEFLVRRKKPVVQLRFYTDFIQVKDEFTFMKISFFIMSFTT